MLNKAVNDDNILCASTDLKPRGQSGSGAAYFLNMKVPNVSSNTAQQALMRAWRVQGPEAPPQLSELPVPTIAKPNQVLIKVKAASVNPIDTRMAKGYGRSVLGVWKQVSERNLGASVFPLITGRDCSGVVEKIGDDVKMLRPGDEVMAVIPVILPGSHAEYVLTEESCCAPKPQNLDFAQAAALPYVANTAWAALVGNAKINPSKITTKAVLIHGGAGGIGTLAIQMLKAWGVDKVVVTCSTESVDAVQELGAFPVDYKAASARDQIKEQGPYDVIFDCVDTDLARWSDEVMRNWGSCVHVSLINPMLEDTDKYGVMLGIACTSMKYIARSYKSALRGKWFSYAYFAPSQECLKQLTTFATEGKIKPIVEQVLPFEELPKAFEKVSQLHGRGKTVLTW